MSVLLGLIHLGIGAVWLGSMVYSLGVVQPRIGRLFNDPVKAEDVYRELAAGNRWRVVAMIVFLGLSGVALLATAPLMRRSHRHGSQAEHAQVGARALDAYRRQE